MPSVPVRVSAGPEAVLAGRHTREPLEEQAERLHARVAQPACHERRGVGRVLQQVLRHLQTFELEAFVGRLAGLELQQVFEVGSRESQFRGKRGGRGQPAALQPAGRQVGVEQPGGPAQECLVLVLAGDELTFVEPCAVVQQQLDVAGEDGARMGVDGVVQFLLDVLQAAGHRGSLALRQVQRLLLAVAEEGVVADVVVQRRAEQQVGVERQQPPFVGQGVVGGHAEDGSRCEEHHGGGGEVVVLPSAAVASVGALLDEQDGIELELHGVAPQLRVLQVDERRLRMEGPASQAAVAVVYTFEVQCVVLIFHRWSVIVNSLGFSFVCKSSG